MPSLTRGPLPTSVYWRRRLVLLTVAVILVVAIARMLGHGSDASSASQGPGAQGVAAVTSEDSAPSPSLSPTVQRTRRTPSPNIPTSSAPAVPTGTCQRSDVVVTPHVDQAVIGEPVTITLDISTVNEPACYWQLSPHNAQVRISRGGATVWSTVDCGLAIPSQQVVARQDEPTSVPIQWAGHRSDTACSSHDPWVRTPGRLWVSAAALGGEPSTSSFLLLKTAPPPSGSTTPSTTATPSMTATPNATAGPSGRSRPHASASNSPSYTAD